MNTQTLRFAPEILRRLGEELVSNPDQGIVELVRNAYDADAVSCTVELTDTECFGGNVGIFDDGVGMTPQEIQQGWLVLGHSRKSSNHPTALGRFPGGNKGLGRLAALRMGRKALLRTRPQAHPGVQYSLILDWARFDSAETVDSVLLEINQESTQLSHGTDIIMSDLIYMFSRADVQRLARSLLLLSSPFDSQSGFRPRLVAPTFVDLEERVRNAYFDDAEYRLVADLNCEGVVSGRVFDSMGHPLFTCDSIGRPPYDTVEATFELWIFSLGKAGFACRTTTVGEVRKWLDVVGGVHLYERGLRVHPYGDPGHDWLDMNLSRARSPEERPSTNNSIGRVVLANSGDILVQKTDRSGFIENQAFMELRRFAKDALAWLAKERMAVAEKRREQERAKEVPKNIAQATTVLKQAVADLPVSDQHKVTNAITRLERARQREAEVLRDEVQLYRSLATVGTASAVFAHESSATLRRAEEAAIEIRELAQGQSVLFERETVSDLSEVIIRSARGLGDFAGLSRNLLQKAKRRQGSIDVHDAIREVHSVFGPFLQAARIEVSVELTNDSTPKVLGTAAALESIFANLFTNSMYELIHASPKPEPCEIVVEAEMVGETLFVWFRDNGPGITQLPIDEIWLPGKTSKPDGTGFGLTIVKDAVTDLGGTITAQAHGPIGGAQFTVELPVFGVNR